MVEDGYRFKGTVASNLDNPSRKTLICTDNGSLIGTSSFGKSGFEKFGDRREIISIYLLPDYWGIGYGKLLLQAAISGLEKERLRSI